MPLIAPTSAGGRSESGYWHSGYTLKIRTSLNQILFGTCNWLSYPASRRRLPDALALQGEAHASQTLQSDLNR